MISPLDFARVALLPLTLLVAACSSMGAETAPPPTAAGVGYAESARSVAATVGAVETEVEGLPPVSVVARLDHAANAAGVGLDLPPTRIVFFGNPQLGTPLMQRSQTAGIDLPQHVLAYEDGGTVYALYNTADYLAARHGLSGVATLGGIADALESIVGSATGGAVERTGAGSVEEGEGLVVVPSAFSVDETFGRLRSAVEARPPLSVVFALDHAANAASVGLELRPTRLLAFGNPRLGTPLMQAERSIGLDLPQKVLVWEDAAGDVFLAYNDPAYLAARHGIEGQAETLQTISDALAGLAAEATRDG